jgi:hypothetical protein
MRRPRIEGNGKPEETLTRRIPRPQRVTAQSIEAQLDWREHANDDLVLALAIATWQAEQNPGLGFSCSCGVSEVDGWAGL